MLYHVLDLRSAPCCQMKPISNLRRCLFSLVLMTCLWAGNALVQVAIVAVNGSSNPDCSKVAIPRHLIGVLHERVNDLSPVLGLS